MIGNMIGLTRCNTQVAYDFTRKCQAGLKKKLIRVRHSNLFCSITRHYADSARFWNYTQIVDYLIENALAYSAAASVMKRIFLH
jgi:hypothetical protein